MLAWFGSGPRELPTRPPPAPSYFVSTPGRPARLYSRKEIALHLGRGTRYVAELCKRVDNYAGRYDLDQVKAALRSGVKPLGRRDARRDPVDPS